MEPLAIAIDSTSVYVADYGGSAIVKIPKGGGTAVTLASGSSVGPETIAVDSAYVYWANASSSGEIMKVPLDGGTPITLATGQNLALRIAIDATSVYWTTRADGTVKKVAK